MTTLLGHDDLGLDLSFSPLGNDLALSPSTPLDAVPINDDAGPTITVNTKVPAAGSASATAPGATPTTATAAQFPAPKTDKPRPHVCTTCQRSFARLEHLKRHERSHTKEKPFECDQCTRCFARRDLLLRHQQKLHQATTAPARPRNRRESTTGVAPSRARKSSMASTNGSGSVAASLLNGANSVNGGAANNQMRPRANTISHLDASAGAMHFMGASGPANASIARGMPPGVHSRHPSLAGLPMHNMEQIPMQASGFVGGMSSAMGHRGMSHGLPRLDTHGLNNLDLSGGMRTAPLNNTTMFNSDFDFGTSSYGHSASGTTINPSALQYSDSPHSAHLDPTAIYDRMTGYNDMHQTRDSFSWLTGLTHPNGFSSAIDENAVDGSSPSAISTGSQSGISDVMLDGSNHLNLNGAHAVTMAPPVSSASHTLPATTLSMWSTNGNMVHQQLNQNNFSMDFGATTSFSDLLSGLPLSPNGLHNIHTPMTATSTAPPNTDTYFSATPPSSLTAASPSMMSALNNATFTQALSLNGGTAPETPNSMNGSNSVSSNGQNHRHHQASLNTSSPVSTITDATRLAIVNALNSAGSQTSPFGMRKYSFTGSATAPGLAATPDQSVPSTLDLQKYVGAYLRYFQPHFPFLHVPTISFDIPSNASSSSSQYHRGGYGSNTVGGSGCLILSMAAIGALYELEHDQSRLLFTMAKRMIQLYLDERRKANVRKADFRRTPNGDAQMQQNDGSSDTPVWLVQAMLLNVIYGHNGSDKRAGEIAATHCAALVSLAQGAELLQPTRIEPLADDFDLTMGDGIEPSNIWNTDDGSSTATAKAIKEEAQWLRWKAMEERKRTLYAIFVFSSLLVSSYNHTPALTNSEIMLDLPCDEEFFSATTCAEFMAKGGIAAANHNRMTFHEALGDLLRASEKQMRRCSVNPDGTSESQEELKPSTFGCFILINALHNYIWETRQRHHNKVWTNEETEKMHRHIEPALEAWHRAWTNNNDRNSSNNVDLTYLSSASGMDPISVDSVPLLDLAYVRLFVNLARSKEKFWQRNWDGLAEELCHGREIVQHAEQSPASNSESVMTDPSSDLSGHGSSVFIDSPATQLSASPGFATGKLNGSVGQLGGQQQQQQQQSESTRTTTRREKHLRKAALYAVEALSMTNKVGYTLADFANRELPLQSALCVFDCAQVLAEWVATLQDRVGRYLGVLDQDVDLNQVPAIMLLEDEDGKLLAKIKEVLNAAEMTMNMDIANGTGNAVAGISTRMASRMQMGEQIGYGAKILSVTAYTLGKASVWPVTHLMAECLENHASHMRARAEKSVLACD
ncbi:hypothetical protein Sste5346_008266 [Sporothrix stenoceras]|uniref:C2H2-type domain-containing protein n=1 Tax=Sporothrix stenoceras TaxID=5173 RepID=A0ABR3YPY2_9PEZI